MLPAILSAIGQLQTLLDRLSATRASAVDTNLGAALSTVAAASVLSATRASALAAWEPAPSCVLLTSGTSWTVPANCSGLIRITGCGGGASGAVHGTTYYGGGSAAAIVRLPVRITPSSALSYSIGAGGAAVSGTSASPSAGNDGGDTVVGFLTIPGGNASLTQATLSGAYAVDGGARPTTDEWDGAPGIYPHGGFTTSQFSRGLASLFGAGGDAATLGVEATDGSGYGSGGGGVQAGGTSRTSGAGAPGFLLIEVL